VHFGTGNYHPMTARIYTDLSFFTCDPAMGRDASRLFNYMTGYARPEKMEKLAFAPVTLRPTLYGLIDAEIAKAKAGKSAAIWAKLNSLVDPQLIDRLYAASIAGVQIDLVVRGICCLRPGMPGLSENIRVKSMIGRFLEHARIVCFGAGKPLPSPHAKVFLSSADWMPRNFQKRVEVMFPIESRALKARLTTEIFGIAFHDNVKARELQSDGTYRRVVTVPPPIQSQAMLLEAARQASELGKTQVIRHS
jgi:polyphosphate kinase